MSIRPRYAQDRFVDLPALLPADHVSRLAQAMLDLPSRRVTVDSDEYTEWDELDLARRPAIIGVYSTIPVLGIVHDALGVRHPARTRVKCWANRYRVGERIGRHRDASGTVQLLICVKAPSSASSGGILHLAAPAGARACRLAPGDALLWEATTVEHWTTPLVATDVDPEPERLVMVGRYYCD